MRKLCVLFLLASWTAAAQMPTGALSPVGDVNITGGLSVDSPGFVYDKTNDRVGLGTNAPAGKLEIVGASGTTGQQPIVILHDSTGAGTDSRTWALANAFGTSAYGTLGLHVSAAADGAPASGAVMVWTKEGVVGIGMVPTGSTYMLQLPDSTGKAIADVWDVYACSEKWKTDIIPIPDSLAKIKSITGIKFKWNKGNSKDGMDGIGVSAESLDTLGLPGMTTKDSEGEYVGINLSGLIPVLVEAVKEQQAQIDALTARVEKLEKK